MLEEKIEKEERSGILSRLRNSMTFKYISKLAIPFLAAGWVGLGNIDRANAENNQQKDSVLVFVDSDTYSQIQDRIDRYVEDIESDSSVEAHLYHNNWNDVKEIKNIIINHYNSNSERLLGSILIGNIPTPYIRAYIKEGNFIPSMPLYIKEDNLMFIPLFGYVLETLVYKHYLNTVYVENTVYVDSDQDGVFDTFPKIMDNDTVWVFRIVPSNHYTMYPKGEWVGLANTPKHIKFLMDYFDKDHNHRKDESKWQKELYFCNLNGFSAMCGNESSVASRFQEELKIYNCVRKNDADCDGMSNKFESKLQHAGLDPLVKNERYFILLDTFIDSCESKSDINEFFVEKEKFKPENVIQLRGIDATYPNFQKVIDEIAAKSDENSLVYIQLHSHGGGSHNGWKEPVMIFHDGKGNNNNGQTVKYSEIGDLLNKIKCNKMLIATYSCAWNSSVEPLAKGDYPRVVIAPALIRESIHQCFIRWGTRDDKRIIENVHPHFCRGDGSYISIKDFFEVEEGVCINNSSLEHYLYTKISDPNNIASTFYFGDWEMKCEGLHEWIKLEKISEQPILCQERQK